MNRKTIDACGLVLLLVLPAAADEARHPLLFWTAPEAAALRKKIESEPWAKAAYAREADNVIKYGVMGDRAAGETEKLALLADLEAFEKKSGRGYREYYGMASARNATRYDVVYDLLTPDERGRVKKAFMEAVQWRMAGIAARKWTRSNWLPNLEYVGFARLSLAAAATGDRDFIRKVFDAPNGFKWYFDEYLSDSGFYNEEFGKSTWMYEPFARWCWAMDRVGLPDLGWDFQGRRGATFRGCIESLIHLTYPRVDLDRPYFHFARLTMGDARGGGAGLSGGPVAIFQHRLVSGDVPAEERRQKGFSGYMSYANALEHLHAKWPDAGYGYFLVQHRGDGKAYEMPLRFGMAPIAPAEAEPPPAPSGLYPGRGLVMLRAEEGPAYWESPAPAVGMRLATDYAHHVQDSLAIAGFYAFNRPIYVNHSHPTGYTGTDPGYSNSIRSHSAVMVDRLEPAFLTRPLAARHEFGRLVKFVAARGKGIYPGLDQTRALMLTREYLLDVSHLVSRRPRDYLWQVHTFGQACPDNAADWAESADLQAALPDLGRERSCATDAAWTVTAVQTSGTQNEKFCPFGPRWFSDRIGVRVTMLGEAGTRAYTAWSPVVPNVSGEWRGRNRFAYGEDEPAGVAIVATRRAATTTFVAVHEPFKTAHRIGLIAPVGRRGDAVGVKVAAADGSFTDYLMVRFGDKAGESAYLDGDTAHFVFRNYACVRLTADRIEAVGGLESMLLAGAGKPRPITLNGKDAKPVSWSGDRLLLGGHAFTLAPRPAPAPARSGAGPVAARWHPPSALCLPTGGKGARTLKLRNNGLSAVTAEIAVRASAGLTVAPAAISLKGFAPGAEMDVAVTVDASRARSNALHRVEVGGALPSGLHVQHAALTVANGVATSRRKQSASDLYQTLYSPRYVATYWFMESGGATELLDPQGFRRHDSGGNSYPSFVRQATDSRGRSRWETRKVGRFPYFIPILIDPGRGQPKQLYDHGQHVHGFSGGLAHWFCEDWIVVRDRLAKPGQTTILDWLPRAPYRNDLASSIPGRNRKLAAERTAGAEFLITDQGKQVRPQGRSWPRGIEGVAARFHRPDGYEYGSAMLYPPGATWQAGYVVQPGERPMAFTFCTEAEFPALLKKWQDNPHSGEPSPADAERYRGAFGPLIVAPE